MTLQNQALAKYIVALLLFGSNGVVANRISLTSYEIVFTRTVIGSLFLVLVFIFSKQELRFWRNKLHFFYLVISGIAMGTSWMLLFEAYTQIGVSIATLAYYCGPVLVMMLSPLVFNEKITAIKTLGFFAVILGMLCVNAHAFLQGTLSWGLLIGIASAFMYAFMVIFNKKATNITGMENPMWQLVISLCTVGLFIVLKQGVSLNLAPEDIMPILFLGIINTGVGCYFYFSSIAAMPVQTVAILGYLEPLSALFYSVTLLGEVLSPLQAAGAVLILGGAAFGELFRRKQGSNLAVQTK
ncbi:MAG: EamA family transporter [Desulfobulbaceae bacterium]|nr:EamA family transporter [Desulfobulbaceae bacterium]